jgi:hypothetical protein
MKALISGKESDLPYLTIGLGEKLGLRAPTDFVCDYAIEIRRARGRMAGAVDAAEASGAGKSAIAMAKLEMIERVYFLTRNLVLLCFMMYLPLGTSVHMELGDGKFRLFVSDKGNPPSKRFDKLL